MLAILIICIDFSLIQLIEVFTSQSVLKTEQPTIQRPLTIQFTNVYSFTLVLLTYLLTPWCRTLFETLIVTQFVKNILLSYGTRRFITVFTKARHWTLS
jgi:hypothetical protein